MLGNVTDSYGLFSFDVSAYGIVLFVLIIFCTLVLRRLSQYLLEKKLVPFAERKNSKIYQQLFMAINTPLNYFITISGAYIAIGTLSLPDKIGTFNAQQVLYTVFLTATSIVILILLLNLIDLLGVYLHRFASRTETTLDDQLIPLLIKSLKAGMLVLTVLSVMQSLGWNVASLLAGLGIGGLALALAAQETVSNIFGSVTVFSDRAFNLGDWIKVGDVEGTIEEVGLRSTRVRRFDQALVIVPNSKFIKSEIINFTQMKKRRIKFNLGLSYKTTGEQMTKVVDGIKKIIADDPRFDHAFYMVHFTDFGDYSLNIFVYCFTKTTVWDEYLGVKEEFNLKVMQLVEEVGAEIAFPSQTIYMG